MEIEAKIQVIPTSQIEEIEWLKLRQGHDNAEHEKEARAVLGRSLRDPRHLSPPSPGTPKGATTTHGALNFNITKLEQFTEDLFSALPVGQLAPIRVIRYPTDLDRFGKPYGLVFGYRRLRAAKAEGLPTIQAQVVQVTAEEYRNPQMRFWLRLMGFSENTNREPLTGLEMAAALKRLRDAFESLYPQASYKAKHTTRARTAKGHLAEQNKIRPTRFSRMASRLGGVSERTVRHYVQMSDDLGDAILERLIQKRADTAAAASLAKLPQNDRERVLDQLDAEQRPITRHTIKTAAAQDGHMPDLRDLTKTAKRCMELLKFQWSRNTRNYALPIVGELESASNSLYSLLCQDDAPETSRPVPDRTTKSASGDGHVPISTRRAAARAQG